MKKNLNRFVIIFNAIWYFIFMIAPICLTIGILIIGDQVTEISGGVNSSEYIIWTIVLLSITFSSIILNILRKKTRDARWLLSFSLMNKIKNSDLSQKEKAENIAIYSIFIISPIFVVPVVIIFVSSLFEYNVFLFVVLIVYSLWATILLKPSPILLVVDLYSIIENGSSNNFES